jgi:hypothetical protein
VIGLPFLMHGFITPCHEASDESTTALLFNTSTRTAAPWDNEVLRSTPEFSARQSDGMDDNAVSGSLSLKPCC